MKKHQEALTGMKIWGVNTNNVSLKKKKKNQLTNWQASQTTEGLICEEFYSRN